jgi:hypothetical protein
LPYLHGFPLTGTKLCSAIFFSKTEKLCLLYSGQGTVHTGTVCGNSLMCCGHAHIHLVTTCLASFLTTVLGLILYLEYRSCNQSWGFEYTLQFLKMGYQLAICNIFGNKYSFSCINYLYLLIYLTLCSMCFTP